jgi:hypothetical protein
MNKVLLAASAASAIVLAGYSGAAEARCLRVGHHWSCGHHRMHYGHRMHYRSWAYGYAYPRYGYAYPSGYGSGYGSYQSGYSGSSLGPRPSSDNH